MNILERPPLAQVGRSVPRRDAHEKLRGAAQFVGDFVMPRMVHGKVLRSPFAHARVLSVDASEAEALPGVICVLTGDDIADIDPYWGHAIKDRPIVALDRVRFAGEPVAAVAAEDEATAAAALNAIRIEYEQLPMCNDRGKKLKWNKALNKMFKRTAINRVLTWFDPTQ